MNAILTEISLRAPASPRQVEANGVSHTRVRPARSDKRRIWIIGSSFCAAETMVLLILAMAGLLAIGRCFAVLESNAPTATPPSLNDYAAQ